MMTVRGSTAASISRGYDSLRRAGAPVVDPHNCAPTSCTSCDLTPEQIWRALEEQTRPVYFLTWAWVENWLACLPALEAPKLEVVTDNGAPIAAAFFCKRLVRRHGLIVSRAVFLNATGDDAYDELCVEHNAALTTQPSAFVKLLKRVPSWDEIFLPAMELGAFEELRLAKLPPFTRLKIDREVGDHYVDLAKVRAKDYLSLLGSSTRAQLRKAQRLAPDTTFEVATDERQAIAIYEELVALHQRAWQQKGQPGAFADPWFDMFHRRLIAKRFRHGEIQLVRLRAGGQTIGCLYNLVAYGRVLVYQTGINPDVDKNLKPGFLTHLFAVELNARAGHATYDFLGGDAQYKQSLGTDETRLVWARLQRTHLRFKLEDVARAVNRRLRAARDRSSS